MALKMHSADGRFVVTTDGAAWEIAPAGRHFTSRWRTGAPLDVLRSRTTVPYPFRLVNQSDGTFADAKLGKRLD